MEPHSETGKPLILEQCSSRHPLSYEEVHVVRVNYLISPRITHIIP